MSDTFLTPDMSRNKQTLSRGQLTCERCSIVSLSSFAIPVLVGKCSAEIFQGRSVV